MTKHKSVSSRQPLPLPADLTLRPRLIVIVIIVAAVTGAGFYIWQTRQAGGGLAMATEHDELNSAPVPVVQSPNQFRGMPLPATLLTRPSDDATFWYVGKPTTESLIEIPFPPGQLPAAPPVLEPLHANPGFLGADACRACHEEKYVSFVQTAHHLSSQSATIEAIQGSFAAGENQLQTINPELVFSMIQHDSRCYQKVNFYDWEFEVPIDLIMGSSKLAQTYLYWDFDALYQMNVTYLAQADRWINSPGYFDGDAAYARPIPTRCLECHSTYADFRGNANHYTPNSLILGISCERCHGPGREHVDFHGQHPLEKQAKFVTVPTDLNRQQQLDVCGQCHSGASVPKGLPYSFRPGDRLEDHYHPMDEAKLQNSVHASNQASRLARSECFKHTQMACADCHNPHRNERGQLAVFSGRCLKCHAEQDCGEYSQIGEAIAKNCIDCHMPLEATENLRLETVEGNVFPPLRDHHIRVDAAATQQNRQKILTQ